MRRVYWHVYVQQTSQSVTKLVVSVVEKRIERVAQRALTDELERSSAHPLQDVSLLGTALNISNEAITKLWLGGLGQ